MVIGGIRLIKKRSGKLGHWLADGAGDSAAA
jgi:hypothetical protein